MPQWVNRPEKSNWGDFGPDDQLGTLNYITDARRRAAAAEIRDGRAFCLSLPLDVPGPISLNPRRKPPRLGPTSLGETAYLNYPLSNVDPMLKDVISDDQVLMSMQFSTQWDSLAHVGALFDADGDGVAERCYYNGHLADRDILGPETRGANSSFAERLSVTEMAKNPVQGRGVLVDLVRHFGTGRTAVGLEGLTEAMKAQGVDVREGDILLLRTGFAEALLDMQNSPEPERLEHIGAVLDGADERLHDWITESRIAAIAADNYAVEDAHAHREDCCLRLPLHHHCLFKIGLPLAELWYLRDLAEALEQQGRHAVFLTAPPLYMPGAVGSPVTPVATI